MSCIPKIKFDGYYDYNGLTVFLRACADGSGGRMRLESLARSEEGRDIWLAVLTDPATGKPGDKPAYHVQANVHARELAGTTAAARLIHTLLSDSEARSRLRDVTFYIIPRVNPDGAEYSLTRNGPIRSRNEIREKPNGLIPQDLDGDGKIRLMRWQDPTGPFAVDPEDSRFLVSRRPEDRGPFYRQHVEGLIHDYDGGEIVSSTRGFDFNRNYPADWDRNVDRADYPLKHPEMRAVAEFLLEQRNIFAGIDFHCGTQAVLRLAVSSGEIPESDLERMLEVGLMAERITGLTLMNTQDYREPWRKRINLPGNSNLFAYRMLGMSWFTIELGNSYSSAGIGAREYFGADRRTRERDFMRRVLKFVDAHPDHAWNWKAWTAFEHPQLGKIEIGGTSTGNLIMPYPPHLRELSEKTSAFIMRHAGLHPAIELAGTASERMADGVYRIRARVANIGAFGTDVMTTAAGGRTHEPVRVRLRFSGNAKVISRPATYEFPDIPGGGAFKPLEWFVTAPAGADLAIEAAHPRGGRAEARLRLE